MNSRTKLAELTATEIADRIEKSGVLVDAIKGVVKVEIIESYQSPEFAEAVGSNVETAVGSIVETKVGQVFDSHMSEL